MWDDGIDLEVVWTGRMPLLPDRLTKPNDLWDDGKKIPRAWKRKNHEAVPSGTGEKPDGTEHG